MRTTTALFAFSVLAGGAALTAPDSLAQQCPSLPDPYPTAHVSAGERATLRAEIGPWEPGDPVTRQLAARVGLAPSYQDLEAMRADLWGRPLVTDRINLAEGLAGSYYRGGQRGRDHNAWGKIADLLRPAPQGGARSWYSLGTGEIGQTALTRYRQLVGREPTVGQYVQLDANYAGPGAEGPRWWPDGAPDRIWACRFGGPPPEPQPPPAPPPPPPVPVPQPPPPSGPPPCTPYGGSPCQEHCDKLRARDGPTWTPEACLASPGGVIAAKCANTCPPEPDEPDQPEPEEERLCIPVEVEDGGIFVPGIPSTGRLELELIPCVTVVPLVEGGSS